MAFEFPMLVLRSRPLPDPLRSKGSGLLQMAPSLPLEFLDPLARLESMDADELRKTLASLLSVAKAR